ncbi:MAG TPA: transglycosylase SLT domain-containing protein [Casimicrobiaceae bacterium]|nr:transglycosylase SLT domain-containing protein [Casimicrobiaceae bacterium]
MRLKSLLVSLFVAVLLAACATPNPPSETRSAEGSEFVGPPAPPEGPPEPTVAAEVPFPFPPEDGLESLPPPAEDLWVRIRRGYQIPDIDDPLVAKWEEWYSTRPDYVARMLDRSRRYLYYIVVEVEERHMPLEIALLPMVESAYNPNAMSVARASGMWQFTPSTGTHYGLKQNWWFDSRRDVIAATEGALNYLQKLYGDFNDWQLALAAYNWGEGNVAKSVAKNQAKNLPADYASITMPDETRNYLPKLQAIKNIVRDPEKYGLELGDIPDAPYFAVVKTNRKIDVKAAAGLAEMSVDEFQYLNPQHNRPVIAGGDEYTILLPIDKAEVFAAKLDLADQPLVSWQAYRMKNGESLQQIAAKVGMSVEALRAVNGIGAKAKVPIGHTLLVPSQGPAEVAEETLKNAVFTTVPQGRTFYYRVNRGDTLAGIASRYAVTVADLRRWNTIPASGGVTTGQRLRITSDLGPPTARAKRTAGAKSPTTTVSSKSKIKRVKPAANNGTAAPTAKAKAVAGS